MNKVKVLFFSADPSGTLRLCEDMRRIMEKVRMAEHREALEFLWRPAARSDDMIQALNEVSPDVVHFSGHGGSRGLVLLGDEGRASHTVGAEALARLFRVFRGQIRLAVLNACFSLPQAEAIAAEVGCAIGTRAAISDDAAITFGATFYGAIAFGHSVQAAFDQACAALALKHFEERDCPALVVRPGIDPARLFLVAAKDAEARDGVVEDKSQPRETAQPPASRPAASRRRTWLLPASVTSASVAAAALTLALSTGPELARGDRAGEQVGGDESVHVPRRPDGQPVATSDSPSGSHPETQSGAIVEKVETGGVADVREMPGEADGAPAEAGRIAERDEPSPREPLPEPTVPAPRDRPSPARVSGAPVSESEMAAARQHFRERRYRESAPIFERAAAADDSEAMGYLGIQTLRGWGTEKRVGEGVALLRRAAAAGDARAINALGVVHEEGEGVQRNVAEARRWYELAAEKGYAEAMNNIGGMYRRGVGVEERNDSLALHWYRRAAAAGSLDAMVNAGMMYKLGMGTPRDIDEAIRLFQDAAEAGSTRGMVQLGGVYRDGNGVRRDYGIARNFFHQAANAGSAEGMNDLGTIFYHGWGVPRNREQAIHWFRLAAAAGSREAAGNLEALGAS